MPDKLYALHQTSFSTRNYILNSLPKEDLDRLLPDLERVELPHGKIIFQPDEKIKYVYFPETAMISVVTVTPLGQSVEAGTIGWEGLSGFNVLMGIDSMPNENVVQLAGYGLRLPSEVVMREFEQNPAFQKLVLGFIHLLMAQIGQTSLCNRLHSNKERLSRWLLICHDRAVSNELKLTQDFLGIMLGSSRATVTLSAITLQNAGFIKYSRGRINIVDREGLVNFTCDCYRTVKQQYDRIQKNHSK